MRMSMTLFQVTVRTMIRALSCWSLSLAWLNPNPSAS